MCIVFVNACLLTFTVIIRHAYMRLSFRLSANIAIRSTYAFVLLFHGAADGRSQTSGPSARAVQLPLSGRSSSGAVTVQQTAVPMAGSSVTTLSSQVQAQAPYSGSIPGNDHPQGTMTLTIQEAVRRGLGTNLGKIGADTASQQAYA